jgi:serine/threonine protein kinase
MPDILPRLSEALAGRYVIERQLGAGGMATVYLAKELKHDHEVALKVLRPEIAAQLGAERFLNEVKITARLDHTPPDEAPWVGRPRWSPDSRNLFFKIHDARGRAAFWSVSAQGERPRLLVRFDDPAFQSARKDFATDGKRLYFTVEDRQSDVFVADLVTP